MKKLTVNETVIEIPKASLVREITDNYFNKDIVNAIEYLVNRILEKARQNCNSVTMQNSYLNASQWEKIVEIFISCGYTTIMKDHRTICVSW